MIDNTVAFIGAGNMAQCINTMGMIMSVAMETNSHD